MEESGPKEPQTILYYLHTYPKLSESFVINEIYTLQERGHDIAVFTFKTGDTEIVHEEYKKLDIPVYRAGSPGPADLWNTVMEWSRSALFSDTISRPSGPLNQRLVGSYLGSQCVRFIDDLGWEFDRLHGHFASYDKLGALHVAERYDLSISITTHAYDIYVEDWYEEILPQIDTAVTISEYNKRYLQDEAGIQTPISIVRAGIRPEKFSPVTETVDGRLVTICRLAEKKGLRYGIEAISRISSEFPDLEYHIIGGGPLEDELRSQITKLGLEDRVSLLGRVSDDRLIRELDEAQLFLLPSIVASNGDRDGIPVSLMEAMAMKTVPVSTTISGIPELITDEENGVLVSPRNVEELGLAIAEILERPEELDQMADSARRRIENDFNIAQEALKLEEVFSEDNVSIQT